MMYNPKQILAMALPLIGRLLRMIPFVNNQLIPFVLAGVGAGIQYWTLAGFPLAPEPPVIEGTFAAVTNLYEHVGAVKDGAVTLGGHFFALGMGAFQSYMSSRWFKSYKYRGRWKDAEQKGLIGNGWKPSKWERF